MTYSEYIESLWGRVSHKLFWLCYWYLYESFDKLNNKVTEYMRKQDIASAKLYCQIIALKQVYLNKIELEK